MTEHEVHVQATVKLVESVCREAQRRVVAGEDWLEVSEDVERACSLLEDEAYDPDTNTFRTDLKNLAFVMLTNFYSLAAARG
jgi:hypothetical protein